MSLSTQPEECQKMAEPEKSIDELLERIVSDNAALFELLATNGKSKK